MFKNIFKSRPGKFLGVDVGTSYIKIVELSRQGKGFKLENYGELGVNYPEKKSFRDFKKDTLLLSNRDIGSAIRLICEEAKIQTKDVNFSIPDFSTFFTLLELPVMTEEEIPQAIQYEVRPYIPLPLSEITLDWSITAGEIGKTSLKILVAAIPNDAVNQYREIANISKLTLHSLEPEVSSLARSLRLFIGDSGEITSLIDIGARSTTCNIFEGGILKISHSFNIGSNELTQTLVKSLNIDYNEAEELKKEYGLISNSADQISIREILLPLVDAILNETKRIFRNFFQREGKEVEKIVLTGGVSFLPGLTEYIQSELQRKVIIPNPFLNISCPSVLAKTLEKSGPSYGVAIGLALKGFE